MVRSLKKIAHSGNNMFLIGIQTVYYLGTPKYDGQRFSHRHIFRYTNFFSRTIFSQHEVCKVSSVTQDQKL